MTFLDNLSVENGKPVDVVEDRLLLCESILVSNENEDRHFGSNKRDERKSLS